MKPCSIATVLWLITLPCHATITGVVVDDLSNLPVADARVRLQATTGAPFVTAADGQFNLDNIPAGPVVVTAVPSYDSSRAINYITGAVNASDGDVVEIRLTPLPTGDASPYDPGSAEQCATCHFDQFSEWQQSRHSGAADNVWVRDLFSGDGTPGGDAGFVYTDTHDPGETGFCATCHGPIEDAQDPGNVMFNNFQTAAGQDGVTCLACHQMAEVNDNTSALHHLGNTEYRFPDQGETALWVWGPLDDISNSAMRSSHQPGFSDSRFCAACHEYNNPDTGAPGQTTYSEWLASPFAQPGPEFASCQDCHMPAAAQPGPISTLGGQPIRPAEQRRAHDFVGTTSGSLQDAIALELDASDDGGELLVNAVVSNQGSGHAFPTGVSIRNAVLHVQASVDGQTLPLLSGDVIPFYGSSASSNEPDDLAGQPGRGFARVLEGRINGSGPVVRPVLFIDAENVWSDTRIAAGAEDVSAYRFDTSMLPPNSQVEVTATLLYRRAWRDLAVTKGWTQTPGGDPVQSVVAQQNVNVAAGGTLPEIPGVPVLDMRGMLLLMFAVVLSALFWRRRQSPPG
ncbi:MAG: carboxypeptidase regulatory-like domain-containing protein [Gammaproteobacteria bacterium]|nr:carboxypeptidase regulatory-like domain-containing protein [Gammaproteobacteria bacterium]